MQTEAMQKALKDRVTDKTSSAVNRKILGKIEKSVVYYAACPELIEERLEKLRNEWDIERMLEANASALALFGVSCGMIGRKAWLLLPAGVLGFLLQHAIQGWCPPVEIFRRLGVRTKEEIQLEYYALKALQGDFRELASLGDLPTAEKVRKILNALGG